MPSRIGSIPGVTRYDSIMTKITPRVRSKIAVWVSTLLLCAVSLVLPQIATGHEYYGASFTLIHPWAEATNPGITEASVYMDFEAITSGDRLLSAYTPIAETVELRDGPDATQMAISQISIPAGDTFRLQPGTPHLLIKGLRMPLKSGRSYLLSLRFEKSGFIKVMVSVGAH